MTHIFLFSSCHDLSGGCLAFVVLEHMAFCFDSALCAPLSSRSCSAHLVILFANSSFPPALYSILIISPFSCPRFCCFLSVRKHLFCSSEYLSAVVLADVLLYFSSPVGLALLFLHHLFYTLTCLYRTLVGSLPWFFAVHVLVSSRHPSRSSRFVSYASPGSKRRLFIAFSPPLCPPARLKPISVRHAVEVNFSPSVNASWLIFGTEFLVFVV